MKLLPILLITSFTLSGCAQIFGTTKSPNFDALLKDLQTCDRDYTFALGSGGSGLSSPTLNGSAHVSCKAAPSVSPPAPTVF